MEERRYTRHFTPDEANAVLPFIVPLLLKIHTILADLKAWEPEILRALRGQRENGKPMASEVVDALGKLQELSDEIESYGCVVKDHRYGIVDFPALLNGREVFLCWQYGEETVQYWHPLDEGFSSREPIDH
ncbi:MAG: hypothetical protein C4340_01520 [Armatimonadota bacterium]